MPMQDVGATTESVLLAMLALFLLVSPFTEWWMRLAPPWYLPYLGWLSLIVLIALLCRRLRRYEL